MAGWQQQFTLTQVTEYVIRQLQIQYTTDIQ